MSFKSDVFAQRVTAVGVVFTGRTRLRGLSVASDGGGAGRIAFSDATSGTVLFDIDIPNTDVFAFNIPEDGVLFPGGIEVTTFTNIEAATLLFDK
tara:strand:- start:151 stop:435 length:285 start_codon:yes stop_codon:yes gene_type:complete